MFQLLEIVVKRLQYPTWCSLEIEADELESDYQVYKQELTVVYVNLAKIKPVYS